ncbi:MAG: CBS domain-containing protein [Candidatus Nitrosocaldus sp.]|nr:CBS domain-containing protein [Candidatus Nitrosocaldus sp.]MCS7141767.1 CBS domain-containing protein [Candidatus Nitrosocaldus sp.]MDW8000443.1 CBS domain-containing protein [Candidatus Nitrosocaldus sp.]MDW8276282.1 CBS domain-containing protein [Candidatus Nitrosocaldus sp.]
MDILLKDIMIRDVVTIGPEETAQEAAKLMAEHGIGSVVVMDSTKVIGIVTERDLVRKVCAKDMPSSRVRIRDVMSTPIITAEPDLSIEAAVQRMFNNKIRRLPVVENGRLVGIVTISDIAKHMRTKWLIEKIFE